MNPRFTAAIAELDFDGIVDTVCSSHRGANREDAEDAVQTSLMEIAQKADKFDFSQPIAGLVVNGARWRLSNARAKRDARHASVEELTEIAGDAPFAHASSNVDFMAHSALAEARAHPVLRRRVEAVEAGCPPLVILRGSSHWNTRYTAEQVAEARRLRSQEGLTYAQIGGRIGAHPDTIRRWVKRQARLMESPGWSQELIVAAFQIWAKRHGHPPKNDDAKKDPTLPCLRVIGRYFGRFNVAMEAAGFEPRAPVGRRT